jgi:hypothetical protein
MKQCVERWEDLGEVDPDQVVERAGIRDNQHLRTSELPVQLPLSLQVVPGVGDLDVVVLKELVEREPRKAEESPKLSFCPQPLPERLEPERLAGHASGFGPQPARQFLGYIQSDDHRSILISA